MPRSASFPGAVPDEIYKAQVDAMYADVHSIWTGALASSLTAVVVSVETRDWRFAILGSAVTLLGALRCGLVMLYRRYRRESQTSAQIRKWEKAYVAGSAFYLFTLCWLCVIAFSGAEDTFARVVTLSGIAYVLMGVPGRNFASNMLIDTLLPVSAAPLLIALIAGGPYYMLYGLLVVFPSHVTLRRLSIRSRGVYLEALTKARDVSILAGRFDTALNNMPFGLVMMDERGHVVVSNRRLSELLGLAPKALGENDTLLDLMDKSTNLSWMTREDMEDFSQTLQSLRNLSQSDEATLRTSDGRILKCSLQDMTHGGAILMLEDATERVESQNRINELARFDSLTGLPNKSEFHARAALVLQGVEDVASCAMMFIDLDHFKQVNDTLGHAVGDQLLRAVSDRLREQFAGAEIVGRFGGDEFVVLLRNRAAQTELEAIAVQVIANLSQPYRIGDHHIGIGASIGVAVASNDAMDVDSLLRNADMALYKAKAEGRNTFYFFEIELETKAQTRRNLEYDLRRAIENDEFELHFQPIYSIALDRYTGCEALLRWRHPTRGMVSPALFVPVVEEMGLIVQLENWVLRNACRACAQWPDDIRVAINVSALHFRDQRLVEVVRRELEESGLAPHRLEIELTESALLQNVQSTCSVLSDLRERLGVRVSLDDFGTGYSSLSYLNSLPLNKIKIDKSFLGGVIPGNRAFRLLRAITTLSVDLGLTVVVEGVETQEQFELIRSYTAAEEIQGYFFGRPMTLSQISTLFERKKLTAA